MKRCPECRKDYLDDSLLYCLDDGAALVQGTVADEPRTAILSGDRVSDEGLTKQLKVGSKSTPAQSLTFSLPTFLSRERLPWIVAGVLAIVGAVFAYGYFNASANRQTTAVRLAFEPPAGLSFNDVQPDYATISPDGKKIAFSATADGKNMLYVRDLETGEAKLLPGSDNPLEPFWSPDSKSIAYGSQGKLKRSELAGGNAQVLCDAARPVGGSWNKDGTIIFVPDYRTTLVQVSAKGGEPTPVVMNPVVGANPPQHRYPYFLPDGRHFLFQYNGLSAGSLDSPDVVQILPDVTGAVYADGWLVFVRNETVVAQAFDASRLAFNGEPVTLISGEKVSTNTFRVSVSETGVLLWQPSWERDYQLLWFDRDGKQVGTADDPTTIGTGQDPRISPDGKRVVIKRNPPQTLWTIDLEKGTSVRITSDFGQMPLWSPDGSRIAYGGTLGLTTKASNGLGEPEVLLPSSAAGATFPCCWTPDGRYIIYQKRGVKTRLDLYALQLEGEKKEILLLSSPFDEMGPALSPDGKWLAYAADDTGTLEVYVQPFSPDGKAVDRKRVSNTGGRMPVWRRDGAELFFFATDSQLMATSVKVNNSEFEFTTPKALFMTKVLDFRNAFHEFDVSPDGQRFLIGTLIGETKVSPPTVILNWPALLKK
jgi:Tol biopolymer transport system component